MLGTPQLISLILFSSLMQVLHTLRTISRAKTQVFERLDALFGKRTLQNITDTNRPFHTLEHPETLWLRLFTEYLCTHTSVVGVIWLHDGFFFARSCLGKVPGRAPFSQLSKRATACKIRMQILKQINENELDNRKLINQLGS